MIDMDKRKQLAQETLNELRSRRAAFDEKVEGWLGAAGGFFTASSVTAAFSDHQFIASFIGLVLVAAGWLRIIYFRTKIIWIEEAALILNRILNDKKVTNEEWDQVFENKDGCARKKKLWEGVKACPYTAVIMAGLLLAQIAVFVNALPYSTHVFGIPHPTGTSTATLNKDTPSGNQCSKIDITISGASKKGMGC